ncbi:MAG: gamma-glutamyltransferase, partial [Gammaproteobacteria bacterium]
LPGVSLPARAQDTTHFSVMDQQGNRVAATLTINYPFGSCFVPPGTGVLLNDEMDDFSAKPGVPNAYGLVGAEANAIAPEKRPLSSMSPTFVENDRGVLVLGTPGGSRIITMVLLGILDYANGGRPESIVSLPRFHHQYLPDTIQYEEGALSEQEIAALQQMGHELKQTGWRYGNMQAVMWDKQANKLFAASDPRVNGAASIR